MQSLAAEIKNIDPSICTTEQINEAKNIVDIRMKRIMKYWCGHFHSGKWHTIDEIRQIISLYDGLSSCESQIAGFIECLYWWHDMGRLVEGGCLNIEIVSVSVNYENHGWAAAQMLRLFGVEMVFGKIAFEALQYAIMHHSDLILPALTEGADKDKRTADFFARLVRDLDILGGFIKKTDLWLNDQAKREREIERYGIADEKKALIPYQVLESFCRHQPIDISKVKNGNGSWEAYQLCHLAWIFNVNFIETLEIIVRSGAIRKFLKYFKRQLQPEEYCAINDALKKYISKQGIKYES